MVGIIGYGVFVPTLRISVEEIARVWGKDGKKISADLGINEKAVASFDEDSCTLAVESSRRAIENSKISPEDLGAIFVGSESKPYAVKPTATIVADAILASSQFHKNSITAADLEFACKAGTAGIQCCMGLVASNYIKYGLAIGTDTAQGRPGDALEFSAGSGAAAFLIGKNESEVIATIDAFFSVTSDTPDFWRRPKQDFPRHGGRFTGEPGYFKHIVSATKGLLEKTKTKVEDYDFVVFHQPNGKFPIQAAKLLGIPIEKLKQGLITPFIGNTYSAASLIGLASVLDVAKPGQKILVTSFGSGAGSDSFAITVTKNIEKRRAKKAVFKMIENKSYVDYISYAKHRRKIKGL